MKIVTKDDANKVDFEVVAKGECFRYLGFTCIKMTEIIDEDAERFNAIDLSDGEPLHFEKTDQVLPLKAQIVIESM